MATAIERRLRLREAAKVERNAYKKFMRETGIPLLAADAMRFERNARIRSKNRHQLEYYILSKAAEIADKAQQFQDDEFGENDTRGAERVAKTLRALAGPSHALELIDRIFLSEWEPMETAPTDRNILIATDSRVVGEGRFEEDSGWFWAGCHSTDAVDGKIYDAAFWQLLPSHPSKK